MATVEVLSPERAKIRKDAERRAAQYNGPELTTKAIAALVKCGAEMGETDAYSVGAPGVYQMTETIATLYRQATARLYELEDIRDLIHFGVVLRWEADRAFTVDELAAAAAEWVPAVRRLHFLAELECEDNLTDAEKAEDAALQAKIVAGVKRLGIDAASVEFQGDPRGATARIVLASDRRNGWAGEGWIIPR